jgi:hypothetical protein
MKGVLLRQFFGFTEAGRYHSVDRMLLDGPGSHLGDHTGADDRLGSAMGGPREPNGQLSTTRCRGDRGCPAERQGTHGRANAAAIGGVQLASRHKAPHRCLGGRAGPPHPWQRVRQPTKKVPLVDMPVRLDEIRRDQ